MKKNEAGVYRKENGLWEYRFSILVDGKRITGKKTTDADGNKLRTQKQAVKAREAAIIEAHIKRTKKESVRRRTVKEVFEEYCEKGRIDRAYQTIRKQDSMWDNHLKERYGSRFVDDISVAEINDYLSDLYYVKGYSYMYTEAFLKMFYLIFGQAYSRNYLEVDDYNKLCVNKNTKIRMPDRRSEDDTEVVSFNREELACLDDYFKGTNAETAYLLGRYCGLRINECYGLKWDHIDLEAGIIFIDRQMQYQDGMIRLIEPKTRNSKRRIYMNDILKNYLQKLVEQRKADEVALASQRKQNQRMIEDMDGKTISSTELVNCLPDGKLQTVNSMKYHTKEIKERLGIDFKYHYLRHTYGTLMAEMNTPTHLLCNQMGHGHIHVTQKYYIAVSKEGIEILQDNLNKM